jgi:hypothetical protein
LQLDVEDEVGGDQTQFQMVGESELRHASAVMREEECGGAEKHLLQLSNNVCA